jgi:protein-tyrosine phosphatase
MSPFLPLLLTAFLAGSPQQAPAAAAAGAPQQALAAVAGSPRQASPGVIGQLLAAPASRLHVPGVENAFQVSASLFRGAQPSELGLAELKKLGVTVIVNLRERSGQVDSERKQAEALGLHYVSIPVGGFSPPGGDQVVEFLTLLRRSPADKVFVHCHLGRDRTGVMIAAYRVVEQNWTAAQAIEEMHSAGFRGLFQPQMWMFVKRFPKIFATEAVFLPLRQGHAVAALRQLNSGQ